MERRNVQPVGCAFVSGSSGPDAIYSVLSSGGSRIANFEMVVAGVVVCAGVMSGNRGCWLR